MDQPPTPPAARALIALVSVAGLVALGLRVADLAGLTGQDRVGARDLLALALVVAAVVAADRFTLVIPHGGEEGEAFTLSDAVWTAALALTVAGVPTLAAALGTAIGQAMARRPLRKAVFNVGMVVLVLTSAEAVIRAGSGVVRLDPLAPFTWALVAAAMAAAWAVNVSLVALVIALVQGESFRRVLLDPWRANLAQWLGNVSAGLLAVVLWEVSPFGLLLLALPCFLLGMAYRGWVRSSIEANQMAQMMRGAERVARERAFDARLPVGEGHGRLPELAIALNHMLDQLELALHRQRRLMADVAGRLRAPVDAVGRFVDRSPAPAEDVRAQLDLVHRILDDMADIGRSQLPGYVEPRPVRVAEVVADVTTLAGPLLGDRLQAAAPSPTTVAALDRARIEQALLRLLQNTADHGSGTHPVTFRTVEEDGSIRFEVVDEGGGVPAGHEEAIFEPFYRAHERREGGVGLGLALVRTVAEAHGGSAGVVNRPGAGVTFWVRVPR